jgi:hypothetical protein
VAPEDGFPYFHSISVAACLAVDIIKKSGTDHEVEGGILLYIPNIPLQIMQTSWEMHNTFQTCHYTLGSLSQHTILSSDITPTAPIAPPNIPKTMLAARIIDVRSI